MSVGVGIIGCGTISNAYLKNLGLFPDVRVLAVADLDVARAKAQGEAYGVPAAGDVDVVLGHPDVELVVNLTIPAAHVPVSNEIIAAGKHVYSEKPLALDPASAAELLANAAAAGVRVGAAPDTFLGAGLQTVYRLIAAGAIGQPQAGLALMQSRGPESWHPSPEFLFQVGGGPLFDIGPYYLTALTAALGPVTRVAAAARQAFPERVIGSGPKAGTRFAVEVPTHVSALLEFASGPTASTLFSFDSPLSRIEFELTGTEATLSVPDPNRFDGEPRLRRPGESGWTAVPEEGTSVGRGLGALEMARAIRSGAQHRAHGEGARHVVDVMAAIISSAERNEFVAVESTFPAREPLPVGWDPFARTLD